MYVALPLLESVSIGTLCPAESWTLTTAKNVAADPVELQAGLSVHVDTLVSTRQYPGQDMSIP